MTVPSSTHNLSRKLIHNYCYDILKMWFEAVQHLLHGGPRFVAAHSTSHTTQKHLTYCFMFSSGAFSGDNDNCLIGWEGIFVCKPSDICWSCSISTLSTVGYMELSIVLVSWRVDVQILHSNNMLWRDCIPQKIDDYKHSTWGNIPFPNTVDRVQGCCSPALTSL